MGDMGVEQNELQFQVEELRRNGLIRILLDATNVMTVILDRDRRILFASRAFCRLAGVEDDSALTGVRPGTAWHCVHADETQEGCGFGEACQRCSAFNVIQRAIAEKNPVTGEASILQLHGGEERSMNMLEHAVPVEIYGEEAYVVTLLDISDALHRRWMEKLFFHDILNKVGALSNYVQLLRHDAPEAMSDELVFVEDSFRTVLDDIRVHKQLTEAETGDLLVEWMTLSPIDIIEQVVRLYGRSELGTGRWIRTYFQDPGITIRSDYLLLRRIVENMLKNALEAERSGGEIRIGCERLGETVRIWVSNPTTIDPQIRSHLFERSFSTKGSGRGLGTYSMRLLGEKVLGGIVGYVCGPNEGTEFFILLPVTPVAANDEP